VLTSSLFDCFLLVSDACPETADMDMLVWVRCPAEGEGESGRSGNAIGAPALCWLTCRLRLGECDGTGIRDMKTGGSAVSFGQA
jgi:hypothetical protein